MSHPLKEAAVAAMALAAAAFGFLPALGATPGSNPILTDVYTADPAPLVVSNTVYIFTGHDEPHAGFYNMNNWRCYSSQDMTNWTSYGSILSYTNFTWGISNSSWASQCVQKNGRFYWYVALQGSGSYGAFNIGVAVSDSPTGPFQDARGTPLITDAMTSGGDWGDDIDPTVFTDTNGVSWLGWGHGSFYLVQLATNMTDIIGAIQTYHLPYYTEGPFLHRHGNLYYLSYASSVNGGTEQIRYATATNVTGPWTPRGLITGYPNNSYTIQDGIFEFNGQSYIVYHNGALSGGGSFDRSVCLDYLYYNPDGTIQPVFQTTAGVSVPSRNDNLSVGLATNSWPGNGATNIPWSPTLRWLAGSNAVAHEVFVGTSSNAVAQATLTSPEYQGTSATTNFTPAALAMQTMYFWRVDEIRGTNLSHGAVGSFTTGPLLAHRYSFTESGGTGIADSAGGAAWTGTVRNGGALNGGQLTLSAASQQYVTLPAGIVSSLSGITVMAWVNLSSNANWFRIFDFGSGTATHMYLTSQNASTNTQFGIVSSGSGGEQSFSSSSTLTTGVWHQVAVTLSGGTGIPGMSGSGGSGVLYLDGVVAGITENLTLNPTSLGSIANNYIGKSQSGSDPYLNGSIDEFRIYNGVLTAADIAQAFFFGPTQLSSDASFPWMTQDVGAVGLTGSANFRDGVFTVTGSGDDIWNSADAFRFVYMTNSGNFTNIARVASVQNANSWSKAGIMVRESLAPGAANAFVAVTPGNGVTFQYRSSTGGTTVNVATNGMSAPYWVKLVRSGNTFTGYRSPDGVTWTQHGTPQTFNMASTAYVGLAVTSHNNSSLCTATFDNVTTPGWPPPPQALAPTGLAATAMSTGQISLVWNALTNTATYNLKRSLTNGGPYALIASGVTATNYLDSDLAGGTPYYYVVSAVVAGNETPNSALSAGVTFSPTLGALTHRYSFTEAGGSTVADSVGGPVWNGALPNGGTLSGGQLTLSAVSSQYVSLPPGIINMLSNFTLMAWVNLNSSTNWCRVFDFGNNTTTNLFLTPQNGSSGNVRFAVTTNGGGNEQQINCGSTLATGVWHQVAVALSGTNGILYLDGVAAGTNSGLTLNPASLGSTSNNYLGKSQYADPYLNGSLEEFRIYNVGLSAAEIAATYALGPSQLLSTNSPPMGLVMTDTNLTISWPLACAGFVLQSRTNLVLGDWVNVTLPAPQISGGQWQVPLLPPINAGSVYYRLIK